MDSMEITIIRTGAATGVAAKYLARGDASGSDHLRLRESGADFASRPSAKVRQLSRAYAWDIDQSQARRFADELSRELNVEVRPVDDLAERSERAKSASPARRRKQYFLKRDYVSRGTFIAAVGADSEDKQELDPALIGV